MKFKLDFSFPPLKSSFKHGDKFLLLGSCFADEMYDPLTNSGFETISNPFGTLFHPLAIAYVVEQSLKDATEIDILERNGIFFAWEAGARIFGYSKEALTEKIIQKRKDLKATIASSKCILFTFGTGWGYTHTVHDRVVGNCHKVMSDSFVKALTEVSEMTNRWEKLINLIKSINPEVEIILTVSPVRHKKDGLVENNRSKARLIEMVHQICEKTEVPYFPAYEIVIDELRDYRFFASDMVHPSKEAVQYVWGVFEDFAFTEETTKLMKKVRGLNQSLAHKSLHADSEENKSHIRKTQANKASLFTEHPSIYWKEQN